jgi:hypothetical protein
MIITYKTLVGIPGGKDLLGEIGVDGRIILKWIINKWVVRMRTGCIWLRRGSSVWLF